MMPKVGVLGRAQGKDNATPQICSSRSGFSIHRFRLRPGLGLGVKMASTASNKNGHSKGGKLAHQRPGNVIRSLLAPQHAGKTTYWCPRCAADRLEALLAAGSEV